LALSSKGTHSVRDRRGILALQPEPRLFIFRVAWRTAKGPCDFDGLTWFSRQDFKNSMKSKLFCAALFAVTCLLFSGCDYDFSLTPKPTHKIDRRLIGDWAPEEKADAKDEVMHVRDFDGSNYAVSMDKDIYRAFHSDFAGVAFLSVQDLNSDVRKYLYFAWSLSDDGNQLSLKGINTKVIPESTKSANEIQRLIKAQLKNPGLFRDELRFVRKQPTR